MLIGIDVGGTTTDAVLVEAGQVKKTAYVPTDHQNLLNCLLEALDQIIAGVQPSRIERVVLSTTLITNMIAEGKTDPVALMLIPGPGTNPQDYHLGDDTFIVKGAIDYRGREIQKLDEAGVKKAAADISAKGFSKVAIVGKFGQRNHVHELQAGEIVSSAIPGAQIELGHRVSGQLNFPRRAATTMLTAATKEKYREFADHITRAFEQRRIGCPIYILKADGGTLPLQTSLEMPVETIFSGPAASTMGVMALTPPDQTSVVVDIGGTTTDLALILSGKPLLSSKGARVDSLLTHVRAFAVKSLAIGGDSAVSISSDCLAVGPQRLGAALCMGGPSATPTDAMRILGLSEIGDLGRARKAMEDLGRQMGTTPTQAAQMVVDAVVDKIVSEIRQMFLEWEQEPAYRVWEIMQRGEIEAQNVAGVGGGAPPLVPLIAQKLGARPIVPDYAPVANAVGAAVARPTLTLSLRIDTERGEYIIAEEGVTGKVGDRKMNLEEAEKMARRLLAERAERLGIGEYASEAEVTYSEVFNMVRGWSTVGRLLSVRMEIPAGLLTGWERC
jgi:N-methylhydantoinase A